MDKPSSECLDLHEYIEQFIDLLRNGSVQVYNECSLQCELWLFLSQRLPSGWKVELERNVSHFDLVKTGLLKSELDIAVYRNDDRHCIELKFPQNGQVPEQMFKACMDIRFLEQLVNAGFSSGILVMLTPDHLFCVPARKNSGLYAMFRCGQEVTGDIIKPTGKKDESFTVCGSYPISWNNVMGKLRYCTVKVKSPK